MDKGLDIVDYLSEFHKTEDTALSSRKLRELFNLHDKQVRNIISSLRQNGEPICSSDKGYWYSTDEADLNKTIHRMEAQVKNMRCSIEGLKRNL